MNIFEVYYRRTPSLRRSWQMPIGTPLASVSLHNAQAVILEQLRSTIQVRIS